MEDRYDPTSANYELVVMGMTPDDVDDAGLGEILGSNHDDPIDIGDDKVEGGGDGDVGDVPGTAARRKRKCTSDVWDDMDKIFASEKGTQVRVGARCHYCKKEFSARSSIGTGHLSRHLVKCKRLHGKTGHQSMLKYNPDGSVFRWEYDADVARQHLRMLIARLDLPLFFGDCCF